MIFTSNLNCCFYNLVCICYLQYYNHYYYYRPNTRSVHKSFTAQTGSLPISQPYSCLECLVTICTHVCLVHCSKQHNHDYLHTLATWQQLASCQQRKVLVPRISTSYHQLPVSKRIHSIQLASYQPVIFVYFTLGCKVSSQLYKHQLCI